MIVEPSPFDVCGPLPSGTTLLEASAGTGKTFTIAALAARYVAEGVVGLDQIMLVTFSRAATMELRERVRERFVSARRGLADPAAAREQTDDEVLQHLATGDDAEVARRRGRLAQALAGFDGATIATTHGFCRQMLDRLGLNGDLEPDLVFVESGDDVVDEVARDLWLRAFAWTDDPPALSLDTTMEVARAAVRDRHAGLAPQDAAGGTPAARRVKLADAARDEVAVRKRRRRLVDYDDLLTRLDEALHDVDKGAIARARIGERYRVVLVDEFQDTDPVQWSIIKSCFQDTSTLVFIGDPKQAIYAFRGADLPTYLDAAAHATDQHTLARSWRSDAPLAAAVHTIFGGAALGHSAIVVRDVEAAHRSSRLHAVGPPLQIRLVRRDGAALTRQGLVTTTWVRELISADVAEQVVGLLEGPARLDLDGVARPVHPGEVAVLVRTGGQAVAVRAALGEAGVPAVLTASSSVFLTPAAREWLSLLRALEQPHRARLTRAAALTDLVGWTAGRLGTADDAALDELAATLRRWRDVLAARGVAALLELILGAGGVVERLLGRPDGERRLTDVRHVGAVLHRAAHTEHLGPTALVAWLQRRIDDAEHDAAIDRSRRLETDADAVQVATVHASKGLEFPVVLLPFGWDRWAGRESEAWLHHDRSGSRRLDVGGATDPGHHERRAAHDAEVLGEDLRLLYVAMTRAQCRLVLWWAPTANTHSGALHRLLFGGHAPGADPPATVSVPSDDEAARRVALVAAASGGVVDVVRVHRASARPAMPRLAPDERKEPSALDSARLGRVLDVAWRRTSYSALTRAVHEPPSVGSEPEAEVQERQDEPEVAPTPADGPPADEALLRAVGSPMAELPAGTAFGTLVHQVLETVDTDAADLPAELLTRCEEAVRQRLAGALDPPALATALVPVMETPLGVLAGDRRLRDIRPADRLPELDFELPLAGGDDARATHGTVGEVAALLRQHLPARDPLAAYPDLLDDPAVRAQPLRGYLSGSIDAVLRVRDDNEPRYLVVDYKTNWLGPHGPAGPEPLSAWHYRPEAMAAAMRAGHYPLQAVLYAAALHRFLRWRQPGYDPARHLGGVLYLFVRGMCGAVTPVVDGSPCGVFAWSPPVALVEDLSALLDGGGS